MDPGRLAYSITNEQLTVHDWLLRKSDGTFKLIVWGEQAAGSNVIKVVLGEASATVKIYDTKIGDMPIQTYANVTSVPLTVSDHAMIIVIH